VLLTLYVMPVLKPGYRRLPFFSDWDEGVFLRIAHSGYPQLRSPGGGFDATAAFFPLLPLLIRGVHEVTRLLVPHEWDRGRQRLRARRLLCDLGAVPRVRRGARATGALTYLAFWPASFLLSSVFSDGRGRARLVAGRRNDQAPLARGNRDLRRSDHRARVRFRCRRERPECLDAFSIFLVPAVRVRESAKALVLGCSAGALVLFMLIITLTRTTTP
jgi:hypothetical protein